MGDRNADSPTRNEDGELLFVKPWEEQQPFDDFVDFVAKQEKEGRDHLEVRYAQTRAFHVIPPSLLPFQISIPHSVLRKQLIRIQKTITSATSTLPSSPTSKKTSPGRASPSANNPKPSTSGSATHAL